MEFLMNFIQNPYFMTEVVPLSILVFVVSLVTIRGSDVVNPLLLLFAGEILSITMKGVGIFSGFVQANQERMGLITNEYSFVILAVIVGALFTRYVKGYSSNIVSVFVLFMVVNFGFFNASIPGWTFFILYPFIAFQMNVVTAAERFSRS